MGLRRTASVAGALLVPAVTAGLAGLPAAAPAGADTRITAAPTVSVTRAASGGYVVSWTPVAGARGYRIFAEVAVGRSLGGAGYVVGGTRLAPYRTVGAGTTSTRTADLLAAEVVAADGSSPRFAVAAFDDAGTGPQGVRRAGCAAGYFVAARGTGQNPTAEGDNAYAAGLGLRGLRTYEDARRRLGLSRSTFQAAMVNYPAAPLSWRFLDFSNYRRSVAAGAAATRDRVVGITARCPRARVVVFGYSQGAHAVGNAFAALPARAKSRVLTLQLFADPVRNGTDPAVQYRPVADPGHGIVGTRSRLTGTTDPLQVSSWCLPADDVCSVDRLPTRLHGPEYRCYERWAARAVAGRSRTARWVRTADVTRPTCRMAT
jgi:hypothetical protein